MFKKLKIGDKCQALESYPNQAAIAKGEIVTVTEVLGDGITAMDEHGNAWSLDKSKVELIENNVSEQEATESNEEANTYYVDNANDFYLSVADKAIEESKEKDFEEYYSENGKEQVYLMGSVSTEGDIMYMTYLAEELRNLGYSVYAPHETESLNNDCENETDVIDESDVVVLVESGREQANTYIEAGKIIERIKQGAPLELVVFTSSFRVEDMQIKDNETHASVDHYALDSYKQAGTWINGMSAGMLEYMKERQEPRHKRELFKSLPKYVRDINVGDTLVSRITGDSYVITGTKEDSLGVSVVTLINQQNGYKMTVPVSAVPTLYVKRINYGLIVDILNKEAYHEELGCGEEFHSLTAEEFGVFEGDVLISKYDGAELLVVKVNEDFAITQLLNVEDKLIGEIEGQTGLKDIIKEHVKLLDDGRIVDYEKEIVYRCYEEFVQDITETHAWALLNS